MHSPWQRQFGSATTIFYGLNWMWISRDVSLHHMPQSSKVHLLSWDRSKCKRISKMLPMNTTSWLLRCSALRALLWHSLPSTLDQIAAFTWQTLVFLFSGKVMIHTTFTQRKVTQNKAQRTWHKPPLWHMRIWKTCC